MDAVTGAVVIAGLTTMGKPTAEMLKDIVGRIVSPSATTIGEGVAVPFKTWAERRAKRATETLVGAATLLAEVKLNPQPVPGRILMPLLEHASLEEDEELQRRWAALLANSALPSPEVLPGFVQVLGQLTPPEVRILDWMFKQRATVARERTTARKSRRYRDEEVWRQCSADEICTALSLEWSDYNLIASDLHRLQLIDGRRTVLTSYGTSETSASHYMTIALTTFGIKFIQGCQPPIQAT